MATFIRLYYNNRRRHFEDAYKVSMQLVFILSKDRISSMDLISLGKNFKRVSRPCQKVRDPLLVMML